MSELSPSHRYAPPQAAVDDHVATSDQDLVPAGRGTRLAASILDMVPYAGIGIAAAIALPAYSAYVKAAHAGAATTGGGAVAFGGIVSLGIVAFAIWNIALVYRFGQTFGKRLLGIRTVRLDGSRVGFARFIFLRYLPITLLCAIPLLGYVVALVDCLMIFGDDRRTLHDRIADTRVVTADSSPRATLDGERRAPTLRTFTM